MSACADTPRARNHTREPAHTMPITSALSVRGEPDWASRDAPAPPPLLHSAPGGAYLSAASDHLPQALGEPRRVFATVATPMITTLVAFRSAAPVHNTILGYITTMLNGKVVL